jgi:demethoxyubiquinone hydroxylase (CLK1/Coq7/Cat5 family)
MTKLISLLKRAHAIEIGAYHAYEGHWRSLPTGSVAQDTIKAIQIDEKNHREDLVKILAGFGYRSNPVYDAVLWCIGKSISIACYVMGYKAAMLGAKVMETMGSAIYFDISREAAKLGMRDLSNTLYVMGTNEETHEDAIKILAEDRSLYTVERRP